ncbi:helix-turn-helix transcriptional regulator [Catenovulum sp. SM1970]|uniref:helix-turn-helix domain-containing protein n=1 Tax=Marinifaba aquimaris TaxID=2741323 RepID=UPI0015729C26|nr:helix-turn-helix transcriptional regulator [Marinifaba aquimaris]NTS75748.1 helix-turn-helix transcriptional regulator [Marinifaba aquimaris]
MSEITQISQTLKKLLREKKITYRTLANELEMSEANIKRIFSTQTYSLDRLSQICQVIGLSLTDLFNLAEQQKLKISELTEEQEQELVSDHKLLLVAVCVKDAWQFEEIIEHYQIDQFECIQLLARLDKLKMIQLLPNNRYKILISQDFRWRKNGPLERFMEKEVLTRFMQSKFDNEGDFRFYLRGTYSESSIEIIQRKLNLLMQEAAMLNQEDAKLPLNKRQHIGLLLAMRPWQLPIFEQLKRQAN